VTSILIIEANPAIRSLAREILERAGAVCVTGDDLGAAQHLARLNRPDGVLLDIGPSLEGIEATRSIKAERPETTVLLLTGHDEDAYLGATGKTGADALLPKKALRRALLPTLRGLNHRAFFRLWDGRERRRTPTGEAWGGRERRRQTDSGTPSGR
jgi:DNA-binding response OmpR family regulator